MKRKEKVAALFKKNDVDRTLVCLNSPLSFWTKYKNMEESLKADITWKSKPYFYRLKKKEKSTCFKTSACITIALL